MNLHIILIHRSRCYFYENPNRDYFELFEDMEIINLLIDMKLLEVITQMYIYNGKNNMNMYIKVTAKDLTFIKSYNLF